jgi:hypothetical protein
MIKKLKQFPLVGLTLAIAMAYVLSHVVIRIGESLYADPPSFSVYRAPAGPVVLDQSKAVAITPSPGYAVIDPQSPATTADPVKDAKRTDLLKRLGKIQPSK